MKKVLLFLFALLVSINMAQTKPISASKIATFTVPSYEGLDSAQAAVLPYYGDLGVRRVIVADPDNDGQQEVIATDYTNGGRVHVLELNGDKLEIVWSSPANVGTGSGSTPRFPQVGDCDGDGNPEIIFERRYISNPDSSVGRITFYEWNGSDWGTEPAFFITPSMLEAAGGREGIRFWREVLSVYDYDGDGKSEIIPHGNSPRKDVLILGIQNQFPGFASIVIEGGKPGVQTNGGDWTAGGSYWNTVPADIDGDGMIEMVNHTWNNFGMWSIDVLGPDSYRYPEATDNTDAKAKGAYHEYAPKDAVSYFGINKADVNGDGRDEIVGTSYGDNFNMVLFSFTEQDTGVYIWDSTSQTQNYSVIKTKEEIASLAGKTSAELWPCVSGDVNKDGKDEIYTGGGRGLNLVAVQYKGTGSLLDPASYDANLVYNGEGGDVFATYEIYNGKTEMQFDTTFFNQDSFKVDTTYIFDPNVIDTLKLETPFTAYIFADSVDLDNDGSNEIVLAEQSVYDSIEVKFYNWVDSTKQWALDLENSYKVFNPYRKTIRVLEYTGVDGFKEETYGIVTPDDYKLEQNYPNPFNPTTNIRFTLPVNKKISLKVYDMLGREIKTLIDSKEFQKGSYEMTWDGTNNFGSKVASGHYIARLKFGSFAKTIKMTLLK